MDLGGLQMSISKTAIDHGNDISLTCDGAVDELLPDHLVVLWRSSQKSDAVWCASLSTCSSCCQEILPSIQCASCHFHLASIAHQDVPDGWSRELPRLIGRLTGAGPAASNRRLSVVYLCLHALTPTSNSSAASISYPTLRSHTLPSLLD